MLASEIKNPQWASVVYNTQALPIREKASVQQWEVYRLLGYLKIFLLYEGQMQVRDDY